MVDISLMFLPDIKRFVSSANMIGQRFGLKY